MSNTGRQGPTLEDIEEHETALWIYEQLGRIEALVRAHGADDEMLEAISYLRDENNRWSIPQVEELERAGLLALPDDEAVRH
ncbi:MAG: hypothetical protein EP321_08980 [Sphingomonadales bacterium]|nr:MAG: hypothetical protein EP321_08980 [Sphingomonadales bacterium]